MNLLIVDDQRAIVESLRGGIAWSNLGFKRVFTACSAREARLVMRNFDVDILLTDIEMPEEDGLELFRWAKENYPDMVGVFLTSHAEFEYARTVLSLKGFDYILQPARYEEVEQVMRNAAKQLEYTIKMHKIEKHSRLISDQVDWILNLMVANARVGKVGENSELFVHLQQYFSMDYNQCVFWPVWIQIRQFEKVICQWDDKLLRLVFCNVLDEIFAAYNVKVCIGSDQSGYMVFLASNEGSIDIDTWSEGIRAFAEFINVHMDFHIAVYPEKKCMKSYRSTCVRTLHNEGNACEIQKTGVFWEDVEDDPEQEYNEERIRTAAKYIREHINQSISRTLVAEMLHINEEYFSRLFKKYTGYTFKDYLTMERINQAKKLLEYSRFSISIIATKVGYDNFSYFSRTFKKVTGQMPLEYRKICEEKEHA